jgi:ribosomal protein L44E
MALTEPVLSGPGAGRTVTYGGGSSAAVEPAPLPFPGSRGEHAMNVVECTIPSDMTIEHWRRLRRGGVPTRGNPWSLLLAAARRVARHGEQPCDHLHDTASRYDQAAKRLELLLTCPLCKTEKVIHSLAYEPRFEPSGATIHPLRRREGKTLHALDRAA